MTIAVFSGVHIGRVGEPERCEDNHVHIASLPDLAGQKMKIILIRAEPKDQSPSEIPDNS
jgi:hypothetical protein